MHNFRKKIIRILSAKNYENRFKLLQVIEENLADIILRHKAVPNAYILKEHM